MQRSSDRNGDDDGDGGESTSQDEDTNRADTTAERVTNATGFSAAEREVVLEILRECADSLTVYRNTLRRGRTAAGDAFPEIDCSSYVADIIRDLRREISERGTIDVLIGEIEGITSQKKQERLLLEEREKMLEIVAELRKTIAEKRASYTERAGWLTRQLTLTRDETERLELIKDLEMKYVRAWERARRQQNALRCELETGALAEALNDLGVRERNERHVNGELTRYLTQRVKLIGKRIDEWRRRYDRERKMYEMEIGEARNETEDARKKLEVLATECRVNQEFIDAYLAEREAVRRRREREEHERRSAIHIQAWWRGVMVRRKLGPYRPEEKKRKRPVKTKK